MSAIDELEVPSATSGEPDIRERRYRTVFRVDEPVTDVATAAKQQLRGWLASSRKPVDIHAFDAGKPVIGDQIVLLSETQTSADGGVTYRWRLREHATSWHTSLVVRAVQDAITWVWLEVEHVPAPGGQRRFAHVPGLARLLLEAVEARDGLAELRPVPQLVRTEAAVDALIDVLCDPDRRLPTIVATPADEGSFEEWQQLITTATRFTVGLASMYLLSPEVVDQFNDTFGGDTHWVRGGAVRTYLPEVDPADPADALRHRVLSAKRLRADQSRATAVLSMLPRLVALNSPLPSALDHLPVAFRPTDDGTTSSNADNSALEELLEDAGRGVADANADRSELQEQVLDLSVDLEAAQEDLAKKSNQVVWLQQRLIEAGRRADAYGFVDAESAMPPKSFAELLCRVDELPHIEFTGSPDKALDLDQYLPSSPWAQVAWSGLLALNDYAGASAVGTFAGNFATWCAQTPEGAHGFLPGKLAAAEHETVRTQPKLREPRILPVPVEVNPDGHVFMGEHLKLGKFRSVAPRLHYFLDGSTKKVYVGYIGRHLPTTKTN